MHLYILLYIYIFLCNFPAVSNEMRDSLYLMTWEEL